MVVKSCSRGIGVKCWKQEDLKEEMNESWLRAYAYELQILFSLVDTRRVNIFIDRYPKHD